MLVARDVVVEFPSKGFRKPPVRALRSVSLDIHERETVGLVGESGSGKTTLGRSILGLVKPVSGSITFDGAETIGVSTKRRRELSKDIQVVFQDPYSSLNPVMTVQEILIEPFLVHRAGSHADAVRKAREIVDQVRLPVTALNRLPREFSGGQRQRIAIARSFMVNPRLVVCDEPVSALDVSTQDRVIELLQEIQRETGVAYLFISHDLALVRHMSSRVAVMRGGEIVETGESDIVGSSPRHPYTRELLLAAPVPDPVQQRERRALRLAHEQESEGERL